METQELIPKTIEASEYLALVNKIKNANTKFYIFLGEMQSGKTTCADYVHKQSSTQSEETAVDLIKFAEMHYKVLNVLGEGKHRLFMQVFSDLTKHCFGKDKFIKSTEDNILTWLQDFSPTAEEAILIFDDIRYETELDSVLNIAATYNIPVATVALYVPDDVRKERGMELLSGEKHNSEIEIAALKKRALFAINNDSTLESLYSSVQGIMDSFPWASADSESKEDRTITDIMTLDSYKTPIGNELYICPTDTVSILRLPFVKLDHCYSLPKTMTGGAAGMDVYSAIDFVIPPFSKGKIPTGWKVAIPKGYEMIMADRSSMFINHHISTSGTIDSDYRGEVFIMLHNNSSLDYSITRGDRIAQAKIREVIQTEIIEVEELDETDRGEGGFGHTGK